MAQQEQKKAEPPYHHVTILCNISDDFTVLTDGRTDTSQQITLDVYTRNPPLAKERQNSSP